jgi:hypothetical protein
MIKFLKSIFKNCLKMHNLVEKIMFCLGILSQQRLACY